MSYNPAAYIFNNITANTCRLFEHCYNIFCSESSVLSRSMSFFSSLSKIIQGDTRVQTRDLSDCSRMLYHWAICPLPAAYRLNITANTCRLFEHCYNIFCSESSVLSRSMSCFSSLSKIIQGDTRVRTRDLSDCRCMLYHWAVSPLHAYSITSLQTRAGCLSTVTIFFVPSQVYSRDRCHFSLVFQKLYKGTPGFKPGTSRTAAECSTTELYARSPLHKDSISLQTRAGCLSTVTMFFVPSQVFSRDRCHFSLVFQKLYTGTPGFEPGTSRTADACSPTELYHRCMHIQ